MNTKILIVDDEIDIVLMLRSFLKAKAILFYLPQMAKKH